MPVEDGTGGLGVVESDDEHVVAADEVEAMLAGVEQALERSEVDDGQAVRSGVGDESGELLGDGHVGLLSLRTATTLQRGMTNTPVASPASLSD